MRDLKTLKNMMHQMMVILNAKQRRMMVLMFFVIFIGSLFELLGVSVMMPFIQAILTPDMLREKTYISSLMGLFNISSDRELLMLVGVIVILIYVVKNVYLAISAYLQAAYSNHTKKELAVLMLRSYMNRPYSFFLDNGSGVVIRGVTSDMTGVFDVISNGFKLLSEVLVIIAISIYLLYTDIVLAVGVIFVGLFSLVLIVLKLKKSLSRVSEIYRDAAADRSKWMFQSINGIKDIFIFNIRDYFLEKYNDCYEREARSNTKYMFACALPERIIEGLCISGIIATVLFRLHMGTDSIDFVSKLSVFAMGAFRLLPSVSRSTGYINAFVYNRPMVEAVYENIIGAREHLKQLSIGTEVEDKIPSFAGQVEIKHLEWEYTKEKGKVLKDVNITIKKGESIGIIGESGSGKSTLADILLGLYKPEVGSIYMDGVDVKTIPNRWLKELSYVPQSVFLMDDTIRNNVAFGDDDIDDDKVWRVLSQASLSDFVKSLPDGLDTIVGERGVKFSGGQCQRIAIARALYTEPQILILDEATSALDNDTEVAVMEAIEALTGQMTMIIIAHRVSTLKSCDVIYEIVDGEAIVRNKEDVIQV